MARSPGDLVRPLTFTERLDAYERLMRLDQPIGWLLLLWPALWSLWFARRAVPEPDILVIFLLGVILMRSAGCVINDCADRKFDPHVERTRSRPLATGLVSLSEALLLAAALLLVAFLLVLQLNWLTAMLSFAALAITVIYPFLKRFFVLPQAWLGVAFSFSIPMACAAQLGFIPAAGWALMGATFFWIIAYDTEYAMVDRDDDLKVGIRTSAITLGRYDVAGVMTSYRLRFFNSKANALAATIGTSGGLETGETARILATKEASLGKNDVLSLRMIRDDVIATPGVS